MRRTIYLPPYALGNLAASDDASIWSQPLMFSEEPSEQFPIRYAFDPEDLEDNEGIDPTEEGIFYPDRTDPCQTLERLVLVDPSEYVVTVETEVHPDDEEPDLDDNPNDFLVEPEFEDETLVAAANDEPGPEERDDTVKVSDLEKIIKATRKKIKVSGPTLLYTLVGEAQYFYDQDANNITICYLNDAQFREEYQSSLLTNFGINVRSFSLPGELEEIANRIDWGEVTIEDESYSDGSSIGKNIIEPYLRRVVKRES